jgi:hypothetical protein
MDANVLTPPRRSGRGNVVTPLAGAGGCPANIRETKIAFGFQPQADLETINTVAEMWSLTKVNPALAVVTPNTEDNAMDIGKGDEFPTEVFPVSMDTAIVLEKYVSSEILAWVFSFATGKVTKTGTALTGLTYSAVPSDPAVNCIDLPPFSWVEQIRPQPESVVDHALIGCVINDFTLTMESGPGRANCRLTVNCVGTGRYASPSAVVVPATTPEHFLNAASAGININGIDYVAAQSFISMEFRYNNNVRLPSGFYPGSGTQNGFAVRGRMEYGTRECTLSFVARAAKGSVEFNNLLDQTEGTAEITLTGAVIGAGPATHAMRIKSNRTQMSAVVNGEADGIVTVNCTVRFLKPTSAPFDYILMESTTSHDGILAL